MGVKNLFDNTTYYETIERLNSLTTNSQRQWGKMNVSQMLAHCKEAFRVPFMEKPPRRMLMGYIVGWLAKPLLYGEKPYKRSLPTAPGFIITDERNFEEEKKQLIELVTNFYKATPAGIGNKVHPFFGKMNAEQWGMGMWKHLDHHLQQFGA
ncbi:MAG: DUF1569 domain-containing protein [Chitinophagaceae bacterium]|nr:DUF1569 domain-containing protein [Chitinophagaceae bacterium]